jgi:phosphate starvation-inducible PhoH-like protein
MEKCIDLRDPEEGIALSGALGGHTGIIEREFGVTAELTATGLVLRGEREEDVTRAGDVVLRLKTLYESGQPIPEQLVRYLVDGVARGEKETVCSFSPDLITVSDRGRPILSKTSGQQRYVKAIENNELTFAIGPAGTGKTYLAVALAVKAFRAHDVSRIILTRPAVEAGEKLGFLPGDLQNKVDPYMRPLYDALNDLMGHDTYQRHLEKGQIEVSPLAYMRGRTLDDAFIILDEAQNTTREQMKMFLTRIGFHSKAVVTGDITQIDLPPDRRSGLSEAAKLLSGVEGVASVRLTERDVVRNPLVQRIIRAYEEFSRKRPGGRQGGTL